MKNPIKLELTKAQVNILFLAIKICRNDYEQDCDLGIPYARNTVLRLCEIENKLIKAEKVPKTKKHRI